MISILGPKPQELGGFKENELQISIKESIRKILIECNSTLLTSATIGVEMWAAELAKELKIPYHIYIPFDNYHSKWPSEIRKNYTSLVKYCSKKIVIDSGSFDYKKLLAKDLRLCQDAKQIYSFYNQIPTFMQKAGGNKIIDALAGVNDNDFYIPF